MHGGQKSRTIKAEVCGPEGWWGRGGVSSRGNSVGYRLFCLNWLDMEGEEEVALHHEQAIDAQEAWQQCFARGAN